MLSRLRRALVDHDFRRATAAVLAVVVGLAASGCGGNESAAGPAFESATPGVLKVATAFLPAPGFWQGRQGTDGFEAGLARALAQHLGLRRVEVVQVPFGAITRGRLGGADIALSQLTPTKERERSVDFSTAYLAAPPAVLASKAVEASDVKGLRALRWVVSSLSTLTPIVMDRIRPTRPPVVAADRSQALRVLRSGRADALMLDLPVALGLARSDARLRVLGQIDGEEELAAALPDGSPNVEIVDSAIRALQADGTIAGLASHWLGKSENDVPLILTER